ncbi:MAG: hypothetical protein ABI472_09770 [Ginsengibacter sp.]
MTHDAIRNNNLLDIIFFESRNKNYGAYTLKETYNSRPGIALLKMMGTSFLFSLWLLPENRKIVFVPLPLKIFTPRVKTLEKYALSNKAHKSAVKSVPAKKNPGLKSPPVIAASDIINKLPATLPDIQQSLTNTDAFEDFPPGINGHAKGRTNENASIAIIRSDRSDPVSEVEIMPQYPGGMKVVLAF